MNGIVRMTSDHFPLVEKWLRGWGMNDNLEGLSPTAFLADNRVAGWLCKSDGRWALIESLISDPACDSSYQRAKSGRKLVSFLVQLAFREGFSEVYGFSSRASISRLAVSLGAEVHPRTFKLFRLKKQPDRDNL